MKDYAKLNSENIIWKSEEEIIEFDRKYKKYILCILQKQNVDEHNQEVLYNDILIKFSQGKLEHDCRQGKYETFLYQITQNAALDLFRENSRNNKRHTEITDFNTAEFCDFSHRNNAKMEYFQLIAIETLKRLCKDRSAKQEKVEIFTRRCFAGESVQLIADEYGKTKQEISLTISRLHAKYKKLFMEVWREMDAERMVQSNVSIEFLTPIMDSSLLVA